MSFAVVTSKNKHCGYKSVYFSGLFTWLQVAASGLVWLRSTCLLILEQPLLGTCYSWRRGKRVLAETQWPKLLLEWAIRCIHTRAAGQCYSCKVNISGMDSHSLGDNESHTALSRDVKLRKGGANAQEQSHHRHTERDTAGASNSTWSLVSTQQVLAIIILAIESIKPCLLSLSSSFSSLLRPLLSTAYPFLSLASSILTSYSVHFGYPQPFISWLLFSPF